jgi:Glu-tRNA(Gln) amidotransferase subunit E-like FAD-binding protein
MRVIYKGNSKKLIKNNTYEVDYLYNNGTNNNWIEGTIIINGIRFNVNKFVNEQGTSVDKVNYVRNTISIKNEYTDFSNLQVGDILICLTDTLKSLSKDKMYIISNLETERVNKTPRHYSLNYVTLEGINKRFIYSIWKFKKLDSNIVREIAIESLLENKTPNYVTYIPKRKIELSDNKNKDLIILLAKSILDKNRHKLSILDWACQQLGNNLSVNKEDYNDLLNMKLGDILKLIE